MVMKVVWWMDKNTGALPANLKTPKDEAETAERGAARTLDILRGIQRELRTSAPQLYELLEQVSVPNLLMSCR
jgi:hypothetical protein